MIYEYFFCAGFASATEIWPAAADAGDSPRAELHGTSATRPLQVSSLRILPALPIASGLANREPRAAQLQALRKRGPARSRPTRREPKRARPC
jgi:hypothetical protein